MSATALYDAWWAMHGRAVAHDRKGFRDAQEAFVRLYKRCDYVVQGAFHRQLHAELSRPMP